jgi:hypothetical protein
VGYNGKKTSALLDTTEENLSGNILKLFCGDPIPEENFFRCIPHWKKSLPVYPTTEENLFCYIPHRKKTF